MKDSGFSSIMALIIMLTASILVLGMGTGISLAQQYMEKSEVVQKDRELLRMEAGRIMRQLQEDPTPESDSLLDPVWEYVRRQSPEYRYLKLSDISSRINPGAVHTAFFKKTGFKTTLLQGVSSGMFKEFRDKTGFVTDIYSVYRNVLKESALKNYFTPFGYLNINTDYEYSLKKMFTLLTDDFGAADVFHTFISEALKKKHLITEKELSTAFGKYHEDLFPVISTLPEMNIHFIPDFLLKQVLAYPYGGKVIDRNEDLYKNLLHLRDTLEITPSELHAIVKTKGLQNRFFQYIGTKTWFWRVSAATKRTAIEAVIVCIPVQTGTERQYLYRLYSFSEVNGKN